MKLVVVLFLAIFVADALGSRRGYGGYGGGVKPTKAPTTEAPTTAAPTTEPTMAPTTEAPTTAAPTTEGIFDIF